MTKRLLITGANGAIGHYLRAGLPELGWRLRLLDLVQITDAGPDDEVVTADINDGEALSRAAADVDAVVHLAGIPEEAPFLDILHANIEGTYRLFEAARQRSVRRVVFASSNHAVGFYPTDTTARVDGPARPDTYYGTSKAFGEALASLYADKYGVESVSVRIGSCCPEPRDVRQLATWLSPGDAVRLIHACLTAPVLGYRVVYGISANARAYWDMVPARALGYVPQDDAERYADGILGLSGATEPPDAPAARYLGGSFTEIEPSRN